ncbi:MAG: hypothetical protein OXP07_11285 [Defluviicoccus sp.]|nr:hypothetical protein [Defluviicoccus sp.]
MAEGRRGYDGIVVAAPVTVPYARYSIRSAHWFCGRALAGLIREAGVQKSDIDGFCVASFTLYPDSAVGLMQHLGAGSTTSRWAARRARWRCGGRRGRCRRAMPGSSP